MESVEIVVIGAGVIGLAIGERLARAGREVVVLETLDGFGRETSSRNSEVIHAGMYYPHGSLKARLCTEGNRTLYELCATAGIPHRRCGKLIVATHPSQEPQLQKLFEQGQANGCRDLAMVTRTQIHKMEPRVNAVAGLFSPWTGIIGSHALMTWYAKEIEAHDGIIAYQSTVAGLERHEGGFLLRIEEPHGETCLEAATVINAAGLLSDKVASMAGIDTRTAGYTLHFCKGEYFSCSSRLRGALTHLVYPVPTPFSLGTHAVLQLDGRLKFGPSALYVDEIDYAVDPAHAPEFAEKAARFFPEVTAGDLSPDQAGIRPKLQAPGQPAADFIIAEESGRGLPGLINLIGMESPGLTASPAIAAHVCSLIG